MTTVTALTSFVIILFLFCVFAFFHWVYPVIWQKVATSYPQAKKPKRSEIEEARNAVLESKLTGIRMHEELRRQARVLNMDETEVAISN